MLTRRLFTHLSSAGLIAGAFGLATPAFAHREAASSTDIIWSKTSQALHITHVMHTHDAQRALFHAGRIEKPDLTPLKAQAILALYISETFSVSLPDQPLALNIIGAEIIGRNVYVYHEVALRMRPETLTVHTEMFQDLVDNFINHIDVDTKDGTRSFRQTKNSEPITINF